MERLPAKCLIHAKTHSKYYRKETQVSAWIPCRRGLQPRLIAVDKIPRSAPYVNGAFMETLYDGKTGIGKAHARQHFIGIENVLLWSEENFRYPQVN